MPGTQPPSGWENDDVIAYFTDVYAKLIAGLCERIGEVRYIGPVSQDLLIAVTPDHWQRAICRPALFGS